MQIVDNHKIEEVRFGLKRFSVELQIPEAALCLEVRRDFALETLCYKLKAALWGREVKSVTVEWPATWVEHFKQRWFPAWALRKWPVKMAQRTVCVEEYYPDLTFPARPSVVRLLVKK